MLILQFVILCQIFSNKNEIFLVLAMYSLLHFYILQDSSGPYFGYDTKIIHCGYFSPTAPLKRLNWLDQRKMSRALKLDSN